MKYLTLKVDFICAFVLLFMANTTMFAIDIDEYKDKYLYCFSDSCQSNIAINQFYKNSTDVALSVNLDAYHKAVKNKNIDYIYEIGKRITVRFLIEKGTIIDLENFINVHIELMKGTKYESQLYLNISYCYDHFNIREKDVFYTQEAYRIAQNTNDTIMILKSLSYLLFTYSDIENNEKIEEILAFDYQQYIPTAQSPLNYIDSYWFIYRFNLVKNVGTENFDDELKKLKNQPFYSLLPLFAITEIAILDLNNKIAKKQKVSIQDLNKIILAVEDDKFSWHIKKYLKTKFYLVLLENELPYISKQKWDELLPQFLADIREFDYFSKTEHFKSLIAKHERLYNPEIAYRLSKELNNIHEENNLDRTSSLISITVEQTQALNELKVKLKTTALENYYLNKKVKWTIFSTVLLLIICLVLFYFYRYYLEVEKKLSNLNQNLVLKSKSIDHKNSVLEQFSHTIAHDFAEPIRSLKNTLTFIKSGVLTKKDSEEMIDASFKSIGFLNNLIADFLTFSQSSHLQSRKAMLPLTNAIELALINLREFDFDVEIPESVPEMIHNQNDFVSVLQNLIKNSIKYCPNTRKPIIKIKFSYTENWVQLLLIDNGFGIPEDKLSTIFSPFTRLQPKGTVKGSGLGLSIVRNTLDKYDAHIVAKNNDGVGATFIINLPRTIFASPIKTQKVATFLT